MQDFSRITGPLTKLIQKGVKYVWTAECAAIFEKSKNRLIMVPVLEKSDGTRGMVIYNDVQGEASGAC